MTPDNETELNEISKQSPSLLESFAIYLLVETQGDELNPKRNPRKPQQLLVGRSCFRPLGLPTPRLLKGIPQTLLQLPPPCCLCQDCHQLEPKTDSDTASSPQIAIAKLQCSTMPVLLRHQKPAVGQRNKTLSKRRFVCEDLEGQ